MSDDEQEISRGVSKAATWPGKHIFAYEDVAPDNRKSVQEGTQRIRDALSNAKEAMLTIGRELIAIKEQLPHGQFLGWLSVEFAWSEDTALQWMRAAWYVEHNPQAAEFGRSALYQLSAPSTPERVREAVLRGDIPATEAAIRRAMAQELKWSAIEAEKSHARVLQLSNAMHNLNPRSEDSAGVSDSKQPSVPGTPARLVGQPTVVDSKPPAAPTKPAYEPVATWPTTYVGPGAPAQDDDPDNEDEWDELDERPDDIVADSSILLSVRIALSRLASQANDTAIRAVVEVVDRYGITAIERVLLRAASLTDAADEVEEASKQRVHAILSDD